MKRRQFLSALSAASVAWLAAPSITLATPAAMMPPAHFAFMLGDAVRREKSALTWAERFPGVRVEPRSLGPTVTMNGRDYQISELALPAIWTNADASVNRLVAMSRTIRAEMDGLLTDRVRNHPGYRLILSKEFDLYPGEPRQSGPGHVMAFYSAYAIIPEN